MDAATNLSSFRRRIAHSLRLRGRLSEDPTAKVLDALILGSVVWLVFDIGIVVPFVAAAKPIGVLNFFLLLLVLIATRVLLQRGLMQRASLVYLVGTWLVTTDIIVLSGTIHSPALVFYIALPISASWLLGFHAALWTAAACLLSSLAMALLALTGITPPLLLPGRPIGLWNVVLYATVIATVPAAQIMKTLKSALSASERDLSDRIRAETTLRESEERFRKVFEEGPLGLAVVSIDYRFLRVNRALCQMLDYAEDELTQKSFVDITHQDDRQADVELAERLFRREIPWYRIEKRYLKKHGEVIWIKLTASAIIAPDGRPLYGLAMVEDITELKHTADAALARQKLESLGTLANGIAHDFNNLLGAVLAQADLATEELARRSCEQELKAIRELAVSGSEIVRQLMIYAGKEKEDVRLVDVSKIVEEMLPLLLASVSKHAAVKTELTQDVPSIRASAAKIRQLLMNLIVNASDAIGDRDGVIRVATMQVRVDRQSAVGFNTLAEGDYVALEVSDNGCGMSQEIRDRVFDPFFSTKSAGRGLGLPVVLGIVEGLDGAIRIVSELGEGTTFQVLLPIADTIRVATSHAWPDEGSAQPSGEGAVLVVEDEDALRRPVAEMLRNAGFEVFESADGRSAIEFLHENPEKIDVILLDMTIPGASSEEVAVEAGSKIRVVLTSAYGEEAVAAMMNKLQIRSYIRKPFQITDLVRTIRHSLVSSEPTD